MNKRFNFANNPELHNKDLKLENLKLISQLESEKKQTIYLRNQLETVRTQLAAQIQNKEAQIQGK